MAKKKGNKKRNRILVLLSILFVLVSAVVFYFIYQENEEKKLEEKIIAEKLAMEKVRTSYSDFVKLNDGTKLYVKENDKYKAVSTIYGEIEVSLDPDYEIVDKYFKVINSEYYVKYDDVSKIDNLSSLSGEYKYYKNYIVYNENVLLNEKAKLYVDSNNYYEVNGGSYSIIIKDSDKYGIEYNNSLVYVNKGDVSDVVESNNTDKGHTDEVAVLNYHYTVSASNENGELDECQQTICITDTMFDSHVKYLKDNGFYAVSMRDLELFIDGKIQLPEKSVSLTFDDGWYVARTINILNKYQMLGTLFLIGSLASPSAYNSPYMEVHSHTWDMHTIGQCPSSVGRGGILCLDESTILEDLKKSRESLNNTPYFCYPFYDYNTRAIELLKKAGFTMAFAGGDKKVKVGQDKFKVPRYVIVSYTTMEEFISYVN